MNTFLSAKVSDSSSLDILSWEEVKRKVENAMQMSFEFLNEDRIANTEKIIYKQQMQANKKGVVDVDKDEKKPLICPQQIERPQYEPDPGAIFQKELSVSYYHPKQEEAQEIEPLLSEMVIIPGGTYFRGNKNSSRDEKPCHSVTFNSFALDVHPVTNQQFIRFLEAMGGEKDCNNNDIVRLRSSELSAVVVGL